MKKILLFMMIFGIMLSNVVFAKGDSYKILKGVSQNFLKALAWFGAAIALGVLIMLGIKYLMSGANERANLKGKIPLYVTGIIFLVL